MAGQRLSLQRAFRRGNYVFMTCFSVVLFTQFSFMRILCRQHIFRAYTHAIWALKLSALLQCRLGPFFNGRASAAITAFRIAEGVRRCHYGMIKAGSMINRCYISSRLSSAAQAGTMRLANDWKAIKTGVQDAMTSIICGPFHVLVSCPGVLSRKEERNTWPDSTCIPLLD